MANKKYSRKMREHTVVVNEDIMRGIEIFKTIRKDIITKQDFMNFCWQKYKEDFNNMLIYEYKDLDITSEGYKYRFKFQLSYEDTKKINKIIKDINTLGSKNNKVVKYKTELFRSCIMYTLYRYKIYSVTDRCIIYNLDNDYREILFDTDFDILREIQESEAMLEDKLLDELLDYEAIDDKTLDIENEDDKTLDIENEDIYEYYDIITDDELI